MSESNQNEILLSAFLDGELAADELKKVQDLIARDAHARFLLQQWQDQRNALKSLPTARLQKDLTADILNRLGSTATLEKRSDVRNDSVVFERALNEGRDPGQFNWRLTYAIASSLAAILLLSLLLFPLRNLFQPVTVAENKNSRMKNAPAQQPDSREFAPGSSIASNGMDSDTKFPNDVASSEVPPTGLAVSNSPAVNDKKNSLSAPAPQPVDSVGSSQVLEDIPSKTLETESAAMAVPFGAGSVPRIAAYENSPGNNEPASSEDRVAKPSDPANPGRLAKSASPDELVSINQVFFVDFSSNDAPLAVVSGILSREGIVVLNELPADGQKQDKSRVDAMTTLHQQSPEGIEALFVAATRSQLSEAMQELLSAHAEVSGFEVSTNLLDQMKPKDASAGKENSSLAQTADNLPDLSGASPAVGKAEEPMADQAHQAQRPSLKSRQAMAQRIPKALKSNAPREHGGTGEAMKAKKGAEANPDDLRGLILSDLHWRSAQEAVDGIKKESSSDLQAKSEEAGEEEVVYYLLFVRAKSPN